ncbi:MULTISPECIES: hypothetical protein [unclassified Thioalkalivibrio]|uniref:hypothetical protein n=1 Tax=unclassified Thioalkalivibrio TaxID=2621013 RepID=UPI0004771276|nr:MULTISPECIES: hypothetical protein [unclassified Thioalkalivibrio]
MAQSDSRQRSFVSRYWILIVIVLWLVAWSARDLLQPGVDEAPQEEQADAAAVKDETPETAEGRLSEGDMDPMTGEAYERDDETGMHRATPDSQEPADARAPEERSSEEQVAGQVQEALDAGRTTYWRDGPGAAVEVLRKALDEIDATSAQQADLYGELGNALYATGDAEGAMQAWDSALGLLPSSERRRMIERLTPLYERHHAEGAGHLRQYR